MLLSILLRKMHSVVVVKSTSSLQNQRVLFKQVDSEHACLGAEQARVDQAAPLEEVSGQSRLGVASQDSQYRHLAGGYRGDPRAAMCHISLCILRLWQGDRAAREAQSGVKSKKDMRSQFFCRPHFFL